VKPARYTAIFTTTTNAAISEGVIDGKDIMYVFKTGRKPESPNPATSNPALVIAPSPKKRARLPKMTTAQQGIQSALAQTVESRGDVTRARGETREISLRDEQRGGHGCHEEVGISSDRRSLVS
jgi:hypothetical protein